MRISRLNSFVVMFLRFNNFKSKFLVKLNGARVVYLNVSEIEKSAD